MTEKDLYERALRVWGKQPQMLQAIEEMSELIPTFNSENLSSRQRLLLLVSVKDLYDNREKFSKDTRVMQHAVSSMLLKEMYGGA